jgi:hypothetical protein
MIRLETVVRPTILFALLAAAMTACGGGPSDPTTPANDYTLRQINDSTLPYDHEGLGCCTYLGGELSFDGPNYAMSVTAFNRNTGETFTPREWGKWVGSGSSISFTRDSFFIIGFSLDVAHLSGDTLRVNFGDEGPGSPGQFHGLFVRAP